MSRRNGPKLELKLNLSPPRVQSPSRVGVTRFFSELMRIVKRCTHGRYRRIFKQPRVEVVSHGSRRLPEVPCVRDAFRG
ncbi:hypothetical protein F3Y22_tig00110303pilonHSYRG00268 [Hibiscus syriacus]|uniref:Uncharacterized protein n=1 Tax=Hibiscus syriacus TaxID=106335 RepID=A0A6A3B777_HIBSY|nr:hypothetical protein F3Y22_tig00110303pilonHSYRG00268 [Hibiscus syriacus]